MAKLNQHSIYVFLLLIFCFLLIDVNAQLRGVKLIVHPVLSDSSSLASLNFQTIFNDKTSAIKYVNQLPALLAIKGYATASVDSLWEDSNSISIKLFVGEKYAWQKLSVNDSDKILLSSLRYDAENFTKRNFSALKLQQLYTDVIDYYSNNGYPFATIFLDSVQINNNEISAHLNIKPGTIYHIDTIIVEGNMHVSKFFLQHFLQINEHDIYNESKLNAINQRLTLLTYLQQSQPWQIEMLNTGAALHLYLQPTKNNSINILVGLLPQNEETGGKLLFTGEATVGLRNSFGSGETLGLNWQQLQPKSPQLNLSYQQPYIFHLPFGVGINFQLSSLNIK